MNGTLRCSDFFLLPQIMGLGLVFYHRISFYYYASTIGLLVFVSSFFLYHSGHYATAGA